MKKPTTLSARLRRSKPNVPKPKQGRDSRNPERERPRGTESNKNLNKIIQRVLKHITNGTEGLPVHTWPLASSKSEFSSLSE